jgi:hypothetical protein
VTAPSARVQRRLAWGGWATVLLGEASSVGPQAEMPAQHCALIFSDFHFLFNISEIRINIKNA